MGQLERDTWTRTRGAIIRQARRLRAREKKQRGGTPAQRFEYPDELIAMMYFWAVLHDRCQSWAADRDNYRTDLFRPRSLPSVSQFNRRVQSERFQLLLQMIHEDIRGPLDASDGGYLDGKPLPVGPASKDKDARRGRIMGGFAKGYKLHAWCLQNRIIAAWSVQPLNVGEQIVAEALVACMPTFDDQAMTLADGNYDAQRVYDALAKRNGALLTRPRGLEVAHPQQWQAKQHHKHPKSKPDGPARAAAVAAWRETPALNRMVYKDRIHVEGALSNLCSYGGGLGPLPAWARTLQRVRRWVGVKIILYNARTHARIALEGRG